MLAVGAGQAGGDRKTFDYVPINQVDKRQPKSPSVEAANTYHRSEHPPHRPEGAEQEISPRTDPRGQSNRSAAPVGG